MEAATRYPQQEVIARETLVLRRAANAPVYGSPRSYCEPRGAPEHFTGSSQFCLLYIRPRSAPRIPATQLSCYKGVYTDKHLAWFRALSMQLSRQNAAPEVMIMRIVRLLGLMLFSAVILGIPIVANAQVAIGVSVRSAPSAPVYAPASLPGPRIYLGRPDTGLMATTIITGTRTWVMGAEPGLLWTPGYWVFRKAFTFSSRLLGPRRFYAELIMATATPE